MAISRCDNFFLTANAIHNNYIYRFRFKSWIVKYAVKSFEVRNPISINHLHVFLNPVYLPINRWVRLVTRCFESLEAQDLFSDTLSCIVDIIVTFVFILSGSNFIFVTKQIKMKTVKPQTSWRYWFKNMVICLTPLHQACLDGNYGAVRMLVSHGADINRKDTDCWTPLHAACAEGHAQIVKYLLKKGGDYRATTDKGERPLDLVEPTDFKTISVMLAKPSTLKTESDEEDCEADENANS